MNRLAKLGVILPLVLLAACTGDTTNARLTRLVANYVTGTNEKAPRDFVAAIPYATLGLEYGFTPQVVLVLGRAVDEERDWYAGEAVYVSTRRGRIVRTAGLPYDLGGLRPVAAGQPGANAISYMVDFPDLSIFGAPVLCTTTDGGAETIEIFGAGIPTRRVIEHCSVPALRWTFDNEYWEDRATRYVWRSRQFVHPKSGAIVLEVLRPEEMAPG